MRSFAGIENIIEELTNPHKIENFKGFYVDIGAHDGLSGNNTKYFEEQGWEGICIEPHPLVFENLKKNRTCRVENVAIWKEDTEVDFLAVSGYAEMLSGIVESYDTRHRARIEREIIQMGGYSSMVKVKALKFDTLKLPTKIDFLSIDTEGSELHILENVDFNKYDIRVVCIENNFMDPAYEQFFKDRGFTLHSTHLACDQIYTK
jgi:FkbM family methyltransferase